MTFLAVLKAFIETLGLFFKLILKQSKLILKQSFPSLFSKAFIETLGLFFKLILKQSFQSQEISEIGISYNKITRKSNNLQLYITMSN